jgi:hypothetical protein
MFGIAQVSRACGTRRQLGFAHRRYRGPGLSAGAQRTARALIVVVATAVPTKNAPAIVNAIVYPLKVGNACPGRVCSARTVALTALPMAEPMLRSTTLKPTALPVSSLATARTMSPGSAAKVSPRPVPATVIATNISHR